MASNDYPMFEDDDVINDATLCDAAMRIEQLYASSPQDDELVDAASVVEGGRAAAGDEPPSAKVSTTSVGYFRYNDFFTDALPGDVWVLQLVNVSVVTNATCVLLAKQYLCSFLKYIFSFTV